MARHGRETAATAPPYRTEAGDHLRPERDTARGERRGAERERRRRRDAPRDRGQAGAGGGAARLHRPPRAGPLSRRHGALHAPRPAPPVRVGEAARLGRRGRPRSATSATPARRLTPCAGSPSREKATATTPAASLPGRSSASWRPTGRARTARARPRRRSAREGRGGPRAARPQRTADLRGGQRKQRPRRGRRHAVDRRGHPARRRARARRRDAHLRDQGRIAGRGRPRHRGDPRSRERARLQPERLRIERPRRAARPCGHRSLRTWIGDEAVHDGRHAGRRRTLKADRFDPDCGHGVLPGLSPG